MSDPLRTLGSQVHNPVTPSDINKTNEINPSGTKFNRSVSVVKASPLEGLRAKAKNFFPRPLYKFLVSITSSGSSAQYRQGKAMSQAHENIQSATQALGSYPSRPEAEQNPVYLNTLRLSVQESKLQLERLQGVGDLPKAAKRQEVIELLKKCISNPQDQTSAKACENACKELDKYKDEKFDSQKDDLKTQKNDLEEKAKTLKHTIEKAEPIASTQALADLNLGNPVELSEEQQKVLKDGQDAYEQLKGIKKELSALSTKIRHFDNYKIDVDKAEKALNYYRNIEAGKA